MAVDLEGGCRVGLLREGEGRQHGNLCVWTHAGRQTGADAISLRVLEVATGVSPALGNATCDEVLYVLGGRGTALLDGRRHPLGPETGIYLRPGTALSLENPEPEPLMLLSSRCPDPGPRSALEPTLTRPEDGAPHIEPAPIVRLWDREAEVSGDRWYRVLVDTRIGCAQVTQFVGAIPPGRAPDHYHEYEEVLFIERGEGRMWAGTTSIEIGPGSWVFLPRRQLHCVENTGGGELRLVGVFYPAGSPAVRYDPDRAGDPARAAAGRRTGRGRRRCAGRQT